MTTKDIWQAEADLLAEGREQLERQCATTRYRHLFPTGPNMALLLRAYQELDRWRTVRRRSLDNPRHRRRDRRRFARLIKHFVRLDAIARDRRLLWHIPAPRPRALTSRPPSVITEALAEVDSDVRREVEAVVHGYDLAASEGSLGATSRVEGRLHRGLQQFREALINAALAHPQVIPRLHPQYLQFTASAPPLRRRHPIATMLLVKLPLQLLMILVLLFNVVYLGAYHFFNDERLGGFLTDKIGGLLDGEIAFGKIHWSPMLIVDLLTGQAHTLHGYEVEVWEPYKIDGVEKSRRAAYAEHIEVDIVIHEIIPWNRLGVPGLLEIPWVLHFEEIQNHGELWVEVRSYQNPMRDDAWMLSLINAFDTYVDLAAPPELKKLSYQIDHGQLDGLALTLDLEQRSGWATRLEFEEIEIGLDFEGWAPAEFSQNPGSRPETLPLRYEVTAKGGQGDFVIANIHDGPIAINELRELELASGMNYRPLGDLWLRGDADLGGSPSVFEGRLIDALGDIRFDFGLGTTDLGPLVEVLLPPKVDEAGRTRTLVGGRGSPASLKAKGPVDDVVLKAVGQGLTLDLFPEPAWALDDVDVSLSLALDPRPETWASLDFASLVSLDQLSSPGPSQSQDLAPTSSEPRFDSASGPESAPAVSDPDAPDAPIAPIAPGEDPNERWIVYLDTFRGSALDGNVQLHRRAGQDHIVLPAEGEPMLVSIYLDLLGVNLGQLTPADPSLAGMLQGSTSGGLEVHQVVLGDNGLDHAEAELHGVSITRDRGPADDHLPRNIRADGEIIYDAVDGIDLRGVRIGVDGGQLRISGGVDAKFEDLDPTSASVRVDNGQAFLAAFGLPRWFDSLAADFAVGGSVRDPTGSGSLDVSGAGAGALAVDDIENASLTFRRGTLSLDSPQVEMLGGRGSLEAELVLLARNGDPLADPKLRGALVLNDINREDILGSGIGAKDATIELRVDDGSQDRRTVPLSQLQARGGAYADTLTLAGVDYRDAVAGFAFTRDGIEIDHMHLAYHRPVSPAFDRLASVPIGELAATGRVGFEDDPTLELEVTATNLPVSALAESLGVDLPIRGQLSSVGVPGQNDGKPVLSVTGSLRRPDIAGRLSLSQLSAAGLPLGRGLLTFSSEDAPYAPANADEGRAATGAHRVVQLEGRMAGGTNDRVGEGDLDWRLDATVAFGDDAKQQLEASVDLRFANLPLATLLAHPSRESWREQIVGGLQNLVIQTRYCPSHDSSHIPLLAACAQVDPDDPRELAGEPLRVDLRLDHFWYRGAHDEGAITGGDPCIARGTTCSTSPLRARLEGPRLSLAEPWKIRSGGKQGPELVVDGSFDLAGDDDDEAEAPSATRCIPGQPDNASLPGGTTAATVAGALDFSALGPFLGSLADSAPRGHLDIDLDIAGVVTQPNVTGYVRLPADQPAIFSLADDETDARGRPRSRPIPVELSKLDLRMAGGTVYIEGRVSIYDETLGFGKIGGRSSFVDLAGPCSGHFAVAAAGNLDGALLRKLVPDLIESSGGAIELRSLHLAGDLARFGADEAEAEAEAEAATSPDALTADDAGPFTLDLPLFDSFDATLSLPRKAIRISSPDLGELRLASGTIAVHQCTAARPCRPRTSSSRSRGLAVWIAGERSAASTNKPSDALLLRVGDRGRADVWGEIMLRDDFRGLERAAVTAAASAFPLSLTDNSGRVELEAALSSDRIQFETDGLSGRISGDVLIDRSTWLRDARQGVAVLSFADPNPAPPSQLPELVRRLELDLSLRTAAPFRIDNNVAKKLEARADLRLGGTVGDPDLSGTIDVERGVVDIDILGGAYDVARGRVLVNHDIAQSAVDLWAVRQKPIKINNQLLTLNLHLSGTLDAIQWECTAPGDTSGALSTARGCVDYLIFDAGNTDLAASDVRENRNNNLLGTRFLPLAGRLTQVEINEVLEREVPRIEAYLPYVRFRVDQLGVVIEAETRAEWLRWGWGRLGLNLQYTRGYPGSVIRDSRSFSGRLEILENAALEAAFGQRNYTNRVLIVDPPNYRSVQYRQRVEVPSAR